MVELGATPSTKQARRRVRAWKFAVWSTLVVAGLLAFPDPSLWPVPGGADIVFSIYVVTFALGYRHYRKPRPTTGTAPRKPISRGMKQVMAMVPAVVILVMSALHPTGRVFGWAISVISLPVMFFAGGAFAWRNRVPDDFKL